MSVTYGWRPGSRVNLDANLAGRELERIRKANAGGLTPSAVVEQARSANSAMHTHFEWDDSKAAEQHRLGQAGEIIRSITIDISRSNVEPPQPIRAFVSVERPSAVAGEAAKRSYTSTVHAMSDADLRRQVIARAWSELEAWRQRHAELTELGRIFSAMDEARPAIKGP